MDFFREFSYAIGWKLGLVLAIEFTTNQIRNSHTGNRPVHSYECTEFLSNAVAMPMSLGSGEAFIIVFIATWYIIQFTIAVMSYLRDVDSLNLSSGQFLMHI
ncbi:hypothetical protein ABZP36_036010 [Zizania latifolia]